MQSTANHYFPPPPATPEFLHTDDQLLVVNKPTGLLSVPGRGPDKSDCLLSRVKEHYPEALVVHRLDMETSGLVLFARDANTQRDLGKLFESRLIRKKYIAVVRGEPDNVDGVIDYPLIADWPNRPKQKVDHENGKPSRTHYHVLEYRPNSNTARIELLPVTGRSHQLRVHMLSIGHPIIGDQLYAENTIAQQSDRLLLHAEQLEFIHPVTSEHLSVHCVTPF